MTIHEILENENILADRFGMAAISYIFKAFGDNIRSKEYWPWSEKVNCPWVKSEGAAKDIQTAIKILNRTLSVIENEDEERIETDPSIRDLRRRLSKSTTSIKSSENVTEKINETSRSTSTELLNITNLNE